MKIDTVNNPTNKFNQCIFFALSNINHFFMDPFFKYKPYNWKLMHENRKAISYLRETGRAQILKRLVMIKKNEELPNDILTTILKTLGKNFSYF